MPSERDFNEAVLLFLRGYHCLVRQYQSEDIPTPIKAAAYFPCGESRMNVSVVALPVMQSRVVAGCPARAIWNQ
jgi:hypothetical protein